MELIKTQLQIKFNKTITDRFNDNEPPEITNERIRAHIEAYCEQMGLPYDSVSILNQEITTRHEE